MIDNKEYLTLKQSILIKLNTYLSNKNTNILYMLKQEGIKDNALQFLLQSFYKEDNDISRLNYVEKILIKLTNADNLNIDLFGKHINSRHLFVLDVLNELDFIAFSVNKISEMYSENRVQNNFEVLKMSELGLHLAIAQKVEIEFEDLKFNVYSKLMNHFSTNISSISSKKINDLSSFVDTFGIAMMKHKEGGKKIIMEALKAFDSYNIINYNKYYCYKNEEFSNKLEEEKLINSINSLYS